MPRPLDPQLLLGWTDAPPARALGFAAPPDTPAATEAPDATPFWAADEGHLVTIGPTGSGKGRAAIIPALLTYDGPAIVIDPKGEACAVTARHRATLGPVVRLDPYGLTGPSADTLNPFDLVQHTDMNPTEAALLLADILAPPTYSKDPFWDNRALSLLSALIETILIGDAEARHPGRLRELMVTDDLTYSLAVMLDTGVAPKGSYAYQEIAQFLQLPERETRPSVQATASQHTVLLGDPAVAASLRETSFSLDDVRDGASMTIYLVLPPAKLRSHGRLLRLWVSTLMRVLMARTERPVTPTLLLLDEAAQLGTLEDLVTATTLLRGYGVRVWSFWQDLQQMERLYPADWHTLITNAATLQLFGMHWMLRTALAKLLDVVPGALAVPAGRQLLLSADGARSLARKADYLRDPMFEGRADPNPMFHGFESKDMTFQSGSPAR